MKLPKNISVTYPYIGVFLFLFLGVAALQSFSDPLSVFYELKFLSQPYDLRGFAKALVYFGTYMGCMVAIFVMLIIKSDRLWRIFLASVVIFYSFDIFIQLLSSPRGFTKFEYQLAMVQLHNYDKTIVFVISMIKAIAISLAIGFVFVKLRNYIPRKLSIRWSLAFPLSVIIVLISTSNVFSIKSGSFPAPIKVPTIISNYHLTHKEFPPRILDENIQIEKEPSVKNIIWIVDESITGNYLSINGYKKDTTPDLGNLISKGIIANYGIVNSVANCSAKSNLLLRIGVNPSIIEDFAKDISTLPTIFQYAKKAGFKTFLYDAVVSHGIVQHRMTSDDMQYIDEYITLDKRILPHERDSVSLSMIETVLKNGGGERNFIVFNKWGAHWPYLLAYPRDKTIYTPISDTTHDAMNLANREKTINTYLNIINFTVNDFLLDYMDKVDLSESITFFTSDHGQSIIHKGINRTHCSHENAPSIQANVPLMVINSQAREKFPVDIDKVYSQHQMFPTTLSIMGFPDKVVSRYGRTLHEGKNPDEKRWFYWSMEGDKHLFVADDVDDFQEPTMDPNHRIINARKNVSEIPVNE